MIETGPQCSWFRTSWIKYLFSEFHDTEEHMSRTHATEGEWMRSTLGDGITGDLCLIFWFSLFSLSLLPVYSHTPPTVHMYWHNKNVKDSSVAGSKCRGDMLSFCKSLSRGLWVVSIGHALLLFSHLVIFNPLWPHGLQHARLPCPSPSPGVCSHSCSLNRWCHPTISFSVTPFSSCHQSFPASDSFPVSQLFTSDGQSTEASTSVLPMNTQD